ncbi:MAG TPA: EthD family reductase [Enteractinococcus sp.]
MEKLFVFYGQPEDPAAFENYYRSTHLPLARQLPGVISAEFSLGLNGMEGDAPFWGIFEAVFESREAMESALSSPEGIAVGADVANYATGGATLAHAPVSPLA